MYFQTNIKNLISSEILMKEMVTQSLISFTNVPYIIKRNHAIELSYAFYERGSFLIEHFLITGKKRSQIEIQCIRENYVLIVCLQGKISYTVQKANSQQINIMGMECVLVHALPSTFNANPESYPIEILTITIHPEMMSVLSSHHPELSAFILQYKKLPLSSLKLAQFDRYFLNKISRLINWKINSNSSFDQHLLKYVPIVLSAYRNLIFPQSIKSTNIHLVEQTLSDIKISLERNEVPMPSRLARRNSVYPSRLNAAFKTIKGTTLTKVIRDSILLRISDLLSNSNLRLLEIALVFGYSDVNSLNRAFKKKFGTSMGAFRKLQQSTYSDN